MYNYESGSFFQLKLYDVLHNLHVHGVEYGYGYGYHMHRVLQSLDWRVIFEGLDVHQLNQLQKFLFEWLKNMQFLRGQLNQLNLLNQLNQLNR
jgi:hypothetical protein